MIGKVEWFISRFGDSLIGKKVKFNNEISTITNVDFEEMSISTQHKNLGCDDSYYTHYRYAEIEVVIDGVFHMGDNIEITQNEQQEQKIPFHLLDLDFCAAMCENWQAGVKNGRQLNDWYFLKGEENKRKYESKILRHLHGAKKTFGEDRKKHLAAIACNANILWSMESKK